MLMHGITMKIINSYFREFGYNARLLYQKEQEVLLPDAAVNAAVKVGYNGIYSRYRSLTSRLGGEPLLR